jgi:hypothetical protein
MSIPNTDKYFFIDLENESNIRYDLAKFLEWKNDDNYDPLNSYILNKILSLPLGGTTQVSGQEGRPDLLSFDLFNDTQYWWILMIYNDLVNVEDITNSIILKYPQQDELEDFYFSLQARQLTQENNNNGQG